MFNEEIDKSILTLFNNFLFRKCLFDIFQKKQLEGIEAARKFWDAHPCKDFFPADICDVFEKVIDFYADLSLMPKKQYDKLVQENEKLLEVNNFLRDTFSQLALKIYEESGERLREAWENTVDRQIEMNGKIAKYFFELFGGSGSSLSGKETEKPLNITWKRREIRHKSELPVELVLNNGTDKIVKGVVLNYSESGLCINSSIPLNMGQKVVIKGSISTPHEAFTVRWSNAFIAGLSAQFGS